jgi:uncharacterized protein (TIGR01777 family)
VRKQIIIAGGTGLIGRSLVSALLAKGYSVSILSRNSAIIRKAQENLSYILWDGHFSPKLVHDVNNCFAIINLAGEGIGDGLWTKERRKRLIWSRLGATRALGRACQFARNKPEVFIQASAVGYYQSNTNEVLTEESASGHGFLSRLTVDWEASAMHEVPSDTRLVLIRTGVVLAHNGGMLKKLVPPIKYYAGAWFGNGNQVVPWIHITDEVNAIIHLLEDVSAKGAFNLVAPNPVSQKELVKTVAKRFHRPAVFSIPAVIIKILLRQMGEELMLSSSNVSPKKLKQGTFEFKFHTIDEALNDLYK